MYKKILVPLDGSQLAEKALPYAIKLATKFGADLLLMRAAEVPTLLTDTPDHELQYLRQAETYLAEVRDTIIDTRLEPNLVPEKVQTIVIYGDAKRELAEIAPFEKADLIVMTTHGRTGLAGLLMGSVANNILHHTKLPVMLIRPKELDEPGLLLETLNQPTGFDNQAAGGNRIVVTLDGSPEGEAALEPALEMARLTSATVYLLRVVPLLVVSEYSGSWYMYDLDEQGQARREEAYQYLDKIQERFATEGLSCVKVVRVGFPPDEIVDYVTKLKASAIVMATHARGRLGQVVLGTVAGEVVRHSNLPVMLVHTAQPVKMHEKSEQPEVVSSLN